jgi:hypothetical protein
MTYFFELLFSGSKSEVLMAIDLVQIIFLVYLFKTKVSREKLKDSLNYQMEINNTIAKLDRDISTLREDIKKIYTLLIQQRGG